MRIQANPKPTEHPLGDGRGEIAVQERHRLDGGAGAEIEGREQKEARRAADSQVVIDDRADDERGRQLEAAGGEHEQDDGDDAAPPRLQEARQIPGERPGRRGLTPDRQRVAAHRRAPLASATSVWSCAWKMRA